MYNKISLNCIFSLTYNILLTMFILSCIYSPAKRIFKDSLIHPQIMIQPL